MRVMLCGHFILSASESSFLSLIKRGRVGGECALRVDTRHC